MRTRHNAGNFAADHITGVENMSGMQFGQGKTSSELVEIDPFTQAFYEIDEDGDGIISKVDLENFVRKNKLGDDTLVRVSESAWHNSLALVSHQEGSVPIKVTIYLDQILLLLIEYCGIYGEGRELETWLRNAHKGHSIRLSHRCTHRT